MGTAYQPPCPHVMLRHLPLTQVLCASASLPGPDRAHLWALPPLLQDEIEFGYIEAPHKGFPVVLDSPRDGNLKDFPIKQLLVRC